MPANAGRRPVQLKVGPLGSDMTPDKADFLLSTGGFQCDHCGKTRQELGVSHLLSCSQCRKAYYCGAECQRLQWKKGHKKHCRKPGQFQTGDYLQIHGLQSNSDLNGTIVHVIGPATTTGRWEVRIPGGTKSISVSGEKLIQLRPPL